MTTFLHISFSDFSFFIQKQMCYSDQSGYHSISPYFFFNFMYHFIKGRFHVKKNMKKALSHPGKHVSEVLTLQQTLSVLPVQ